VAPQTNSTKTQCPNGLLAQAQEKLQQVLQLQQQQQQQEQQHKGHCEALLAEKEASVREVQEVQQQLTRTQALLQQVSCP